MIKAKSLFNTVKKEQDKKQKEIKTIKEQNKESIKTKESKKQTATKSIKPETSKIKEDKKLADTKSINTNNKTTKSTKSTTTKSTKLKKESDTIKSNNLLSKKDESNIINTQNITHWSKTTTKLPEELRPIEFNTKSKKPAYGYRLQNKSYIVNTPYFIAKFKKEFGYLEWHYIPQCRTLDKCPSNFPDCTNCKIHKEKGK